MAIYQGDNPVVNPYIGTNLISTAYQGTKPVPVGYKPFIVTSSLDYFYDYWLGSYNTNYSSSDLSQPTWYGENTRVARDLTLSGSGAGPTFVNRTDGYLFASQSNASPVGNNFFWQTNTEDNSLGLNNVPGFSMQFVLKTGYLPLFNSGDYCVLFDIGGPSSIDPYYSARLSKESSVSTGAVAIYETTIGGSSGVTIPTFVTNQWKLLQVDYTNSTGVVNWYINNEFVDTDTITVGISAFDYYLKLCPTWTGNLAASILYRKILSADERLQNYTYYQTRYNFA